MAFRLRPVDNVFFDLLTSSAQHLVSGASILAGALDEGADRAVIAKRLKAAEHECDEITHEIVRRTNATFVTPIDREDIYSLASGLDDVMDYMEEAVDLMHLYGVDALPAACTEQVSAIQRCAELTAEAMPRLQSMKGLEEFWIEVNRLENAADASYRAILADLFGGSYDALTVLKLKDVVEALEATVDGFETVAAIVEQLVVKES